MLDYIWYRIARIYYKKDSDGITASAFLSLGEAILILDAAIFFANSTNSRERIMSALGSNTFPKIIAIIAICFMALNYLYYKKKYWRFKEKRVNEKRGVSFTLKGIGVLLMLMLPWIIFILLVPFKNK